ncbi:Hydrolase [Ceratobasidium theobromae]|uniref:Hydrolase n=1 Tax=Ceratobasidium theobromae TaxID=1582974 RepID=A0A5N5Q9M9_9AGAM|nr:Hydrolase [Ceratobasidium theobromae]
MHAFIAISGLLALIPSTRAAALTTRESKISWSPCPDSNTTQCALLDVPMDYSDPSNNQTVSIFLRKFPATVPESQRLGSILTNPGGPGGSGSSFVAAGGQDVSIVVDGRYDIIGFDPRGVNLTGPPTACFNVETKFLQRDYQTYLHGAPFPHIGGTGETDHVTKLAAIQAGHSAACEQNGNQDMLTSVGTVAVAKDMAKIVEALGEDGLNYWGYSYGTILGATFAAIRPDLVKRMLLDGVSNSDSYFNDILQWGRDGMVDTHKTLSGFFSECIAAGPKRCAFAAPPSGSNQTQTVQTLSKRVDALYAKLGAQPMIVADSRAGSGIIKAADVQAIMLNLMYTPRYWSALAQGIVELEQGYGSDFYTVFNFAYAQIIPQSYTNNIFNRSMQIYSTRESLYSIACSDTSPLNITIDGYTKYMQEMGKISPVGEQWALLMGGCRGWAYRAKERYTGPWDSTKGLKKTKFPILFVSLDADPVTPLSSAIRMSNGFGKDSATLLVQKGYGHCSIAHPSLCTVKNIHDYFVDGKVPANGTHCTPEPGFLFSDNTTDSNPQARSVLSKRDSDLLGAVERLHIARSKVTPPYI